jgi:hypothetical protein
MSLDQILGIARAVLAAIGGYAVAQGVLDPAQLETVVGALLTIGTAIWSVLAKKKSA